MKNKIFFLLVLLGTIESFAKPKIITGITPVASIVAMLTRGSAEVIAINNSSGCPHDYMLRPGDMEKAKEASLLIYIDENFDGYMQHISSKSNATTVKISDMKSINFLVENGKINRHFWLDLNNILLVHEELAQIIGREIPELKEEVYKNKKIAADKIKNLIDLKQNELVSMQKIIIVSDSLEYFFQNIEGNIIKIYQNNASSLKGYNNIEQIMATEESQCIVMNINQNTDLYKKFHKKILMLDSENWLLDKDINDNYDFFIVKYLQMINQLKGCKKKLSS